MYRILHFFFYVSFSSMFGCTTSQVATNQATPFNDDITQFRVDVKAPLLVENTLPTTTENTEKPTNHLNGQLDQLSLKMAVKNEEYAKNTRVKGFKILVYSGRNIDQANSSVKDLEEKWPEEAEITYEQPNYKVKVGTYLTKLDAYGACVKLRKDFPTAIIVQENIKIPLDKLMGNGK